MDLITSEREIIDNIMSNFQERINNALDAAFDNITSVIKDAIVDLIRNSPEVDALLNGDLAEQLGIADAEPIVDEIIQALHNSMEVSFERVGYTGTYITNGGYTIKVSRSDFQDVLSVADAEYVTRNGITIPWLQWLLFSGDTTVVFGYRIELYPNNPEASRTGAIMVKDSEGRWGVPTEYAGTIDNNFITRALEPLEDTINEVIISELTKRM